jgi:serine/threonine protein kinase
MVGQFLEGLARIHSVSVIILGQNFPLNHGDLKPHNILIDSETDRLGITDFGSSCWVKNYVSTSRYLSPAGIEMQKKQDMTEVKICEDLKKFGQKRDVWSAAIIISAIVLNGLNEHFMPPLNFLTSRVQTVKNDPNLLDFSTLSQPEISAEFNRLIMQTSSVQEKNLLKLCYKLFVIDDEQRCTSQQALDAYNAYFKR